MKQTRREFITRSGCALSMTALAANSGYFSALNAMAQMASERGAAPPDDYRALVCIYFSGGNDGNNTIIPLHNDSNVTGYSAYSAARAPQGLALPQKTLLPMSVPRIGGLEYGLHPAFGTIAGGVNPGLHELWALQKMALVTNVGTLVQPITRQQYQNGSVPRPLALFSHSDQTNQHQNARADMLMLSGWGGRIADKITMFANPARLIPTITSIAGGRLFAVGENMQPLSIGPAPTPLSSALALTGYNNTPAANARFNALNDSFSVDLSHDLVAASSQLHRQAIDISRSLNNPLEVTVPFPNTELGNQLKQIARVIRNRNTLNLTRQIFLCTLDGFDTHTAQLTGQASLLGEFSQAARAFYDEMVVQGLSDKVTQFTMSDFNRTFNPGGSGGNVGSDHAWANHSIIIGGAVRGGDFYGNNTTSGTPFPTLIQNGPDDADSGSAARGRWIPTTSVEQLGGTLAEWFGLAQSDMDYVFPNMANFPVKNLGFMLP